MPASSSETSNRWRKRRRDPVPPPLSRKSNDDILDEEDEENTNINNISNDHEHSNPNLHEPDADDDHPRQNPSSAADLQIQIRENEVLLSNEEERISEFPLVIKRRVSRPHSSVLLIVRAERSVLIGETVAHNVVALENISYGQLQARSSVPLDSPALIGNGFAEDRVEGSYVITPPKIMEGRGVIKMFGTANRTHVVPMHSDWFSPKSVHRLERQVVPHFFSGKSPKHTVERYMACRNCIVAKYMENPDRHLSVSDCQGLVPGFSLDDMTRIVRFLDHWGIINYCAEAPSGERRTEAEVLYEDSNNELCVPSATLKSIDSLIKFDRPKCRLKVTDVYPGVGGHSSESSDFDGTIREELSDSRCNHCSRPIAMAHYQSQKEIDVLLCTDCFHQGRFVPGHSSLDFVKVNSHKECGGDMDGESWTDQETLLLLEGMQRYNENWNAIAEHVGSKSKAQCILHFLRIPVDGTPLQNIEVPTASNLGNCGDSEIYRNSHQYMNGNVPGTSVEGNDCESKFPFENCGNPVMALVAFLANAMGPRIAAACAHASLTELSKDDGSSTSESVRQMDGFSYNNRMDTEGAKEEEPPCEKMGGQCGTDAAPLSAAIVIVAAKAGLAAAATKAKLFADHEEREIQRLSANIINQQLKRLELKLKQFAEVETYLMREGDGMERTRQRAAGERANMLAQFGNSGVPRPSAHPNIGQAVGNSSGNNRQQIVPGYPQPLFSGYGNSQSVNPHMSLMSQQTMYGLGPRLPLSALHPSSASANAMSNPASSPQAGLTHSMLRPTKSPLG